ncbi:MAG TPA: tellurite resistance/C4-dicarboxylate transporter family protein [Noviherbaspirillum sp.]|uniref:tellurite resistance/C4-dicarboxylate transporter family protein n=1 Tax=Noviherbaspirillum sp. TaxID=1926288 RepID=UPI002B47C3BF|nr:tellurite resistance/C4-dicarboxylate transporter family protein [Noviherbaspirillum sp.]HJV86373.1 tellurite resistance/C4-dicarboxylate transporter family protein [Noviherbaspirillum sp.]
MTDNSKPETRIMADLADMSPAYFGMVMATGIVSLASYLLDYPRIAHALFGFNIAAYAILWVLTVLRAVRFPRRFFGDMVDHLRGPGFFTTVAATNILGSQFVVLAADYRTGSILWGVAILLWIALTYTIFTGITIKEHKPTLDRGISGGWLLAVVASQSIAVLGALLAAHVDQPYRLEINFLALSMWLWGGMLYIWMMSLIFYRYTLFPFSPGDLSPPYWINMGAMAISTLAGSLLIINAPDAPYLLSLLPFIKGFTVFYWATGTWWIPMLLILGFWRYVSRRFPLTYDPLYWGAVFPLGMYAASTRRMIDAMEFGFLQFLPRVFLYIAMFMWAITLIGLVFDLLQRVGILGKEKARA